MLAPCVRRARGRGALAASAPGLAFRAARRAALRANGRGRGLARGSLRGLNGCGRISVPRGRPATALQPGSAVAAVLLSGDMVLSATGTVTWVDGNSVLAFGHPFLSMGPVDMPMAQADVLTVLPSLYRSFKFSTTGPLLGSVSQDRSTGILGELRHAADDGADHDPDDLG